MSKKRDWTGVRFGMLVAVRYSHNEPGGRCRVIWEFLCDCGKSRKMRTDAARKQGSCGCINHQRRPGQRHGMLVSIKFSSRVGTSYFWDYKCDCGNLISGRSVNCEKTGHCGCMTRQIKTTHGMCDRGEYHSWQAMLQRCRNPNAHAYKDYGGRGISVCDKWTSFEGFYEDMGDRPDGKSLDRIDNEGDYCAENCRWSTRSEQARNTRSNRVIELNGTEKLLIEWVEETGLSFSCIEHRLRNGWSVSKTLTTPSLRRSAKCQKRK